MKKKISSHRIYDVFSSRLYTFHVAERREDGRFRLYPLKEEIQFTEWFPGLIILSPFPISIHQGELYADLILRLDETLCLNRRNLIGQKLECCQHAYWVYPFNVEKMQLLSTSKVQKIE